MGRGSVFPPEDFGMDEGSACLFGRGEADGLALFGCCGCRGRGGLRRRACGVRLGPGGRGFRPGRRCRAFLEKRCRFFGKVAGLFAGSREAFSRRGCIRLWPLRGGFRAARPYRKPPGECLCAFSRRLSRLLPASAHTLSRVLISVPAGKTSRPLMSRSFISMMKFT